MKVAVISANLGAYDRHTEWPTLEAPPGVEVSVHRFTDANFPPRPLAMTARLQAGLLKWFGPEFVPGRDVYLWIDASCTPTPIAVTWFLEQMDEFGSWVAFFKHPDRQTIRQEYEFIKERLARPGERYLTSRYAGEWLDEQFAAIPDKPLSLTMQNAQLFASTAFVYRDCANVREMFKEVWFGKTRYHLHDQLWLAKTAYEHIARVPIRTIEADYLDCPALTFTRKP